MVEIKIKVLPEKKQIIGVEGTDKIDPIQLSVIFQQISIKALSNIKIDKEDKIIKPTNQDINKVVGAN